MAKMRTSKVSVGDQGSRLKNIHTLHSPVYRYYDLKQYLTKFTIIYAGLTVDDIVMFYICNFFFLN